MNRVLLRFYYEQAVKAVFDPRGPLHSTGQSFETSLDDVVRVFTLRHVDVKIHAELVGKGLEELVGKIGVKIPHPT